MENENQDIVVRFHTARTFAVIAQHEVAAVIGVNGSESSPATTAWTAPYA